MSLDAFLEDRRQIYPDDRMELAVNLAELPYSSITLRHGY